MFLRQPILLLLLIFSVAGKATEKSRESYKDIILKAQNLTLMQDREQAAQVIQRAILNENFNKRGTEELIKSLEEISKLFYTEKTQKMFEYARTLVKESPQEALDKFQECLKIEPSNVLINQSVARVLLALGKCEEAELRATKALEINPYSVESTLADMQSKTCLQKNIEIEVASRGRDKLKQQFPVYFHTVVAQHFFNKGDYLRAQVELQKSITADKDFPESYYWEAQVQKKLGTVSAESAMRYIKNCKTLNKKDFKKYELEPRLCQEYKNLESEYKAHIEQGQKKDL